MSPDIDPNSLGDLECYKGGIPISGEDKKMVLGKIGSHMGKIPTP